MNEENFPQSNEPVQSSKNVWMIVISVIVTALIVGGGVYAWQRSSLQSTEKSLQKKITNLQSQIENLQQTTAPVVNAPEITQESTQPIDETTNQQTYKTYTSANLGISFQYPKGWYVKEEKEKGIGYRIYIQNTQEEVSNEYMPSDFQRVWISTWEQEINEETENNVKNGTPDGREFRGSLSAGAIDINGFMINIYEYNTIGGPTLQAFWSDKNGKRYYATNATEVSQENQKNMVKNLKLILFTVKFTN